MRRSVGGCVHGFVGAWIGWWVCSWLRGRMGVWVDASVRMWLIECFRDSVDGDPVENIFFFSSAVE